jgi:hypothetical protein
VCGQQFWLGPQLGGTTITLWADTSVVHVIRAGIRLKTVPSRLSANDVHRLLATGGRPAGPAPLTTGPAGPVEVDRLINACGALSLANHQHPVGYHLAGQRVTVRLDGHIMQLLDTDRTLLRTLPNPIPDDMHRLRDARPGGPPAHVPPAPAPVQRRVDSRGAIMVASQRIHVGIGHAGLTVTIHTDDATFRVCDGDQVLTEAPRTTTKPIARFKARKPEPSRQHTPART